MVEDRKHTHTHTHTNRGHFISIVLHLGLQSDICVHRPPHSSTATDADNREITFPTLFCLSIYGLRVFWPIPNQHTPQACIRQLFGSYLEQVISFIDTRFLSFTEASLVKYLHSASTSLGPHPSTAFQINHSSIISPIHFT
jgi:hypothetical protein